MERLSVDLSPTFAPPERRVLLDDAGGEDVEQDLGLRDRLPRVGVAGAERDRRARGVRSAELVGRDVAPAEARAAIVAEPGRHEVRRIGFPMDSVFE